MCKIERFRCVHNKLEEMAVGYSGRRVFGTVGGEPFMRIKFQLTRARAG